MPAGKIELLHRFLRQEDGRLSKRSRENEFAALTDREAEQIKALYRASFEDKQPTAETKVKRVAACTLASPIQARFVNRWSLVHASACKFRRNRRRRICSDRFHLWRRVWKSATAVASSNLLL